MNPLTPTGIGGYMSSMHPPLHILATSRALEKAMGARLKAERDGSEGALPECLKGTIFLVVKTSAVVLLLSVVLTFSATYRVFGLQNPAAPACGPSMSMRARWEPDAILSYEHRYQTYALRLGRGRAARLRQRSARARCGVAGGDGLAAAIRAILPGHFVYPAGRFPALQRAWVPPKIASCLQ